MGGQEFPPHEEVAVNPSGGINAPMGMCEMGPPEEGEIIGNDEVAAGGGTQEGVSASMDSQQTASSEGETVAANSLEGEILLGQEDFVGGPEGQLNKGDFLGLETTTIPTTSLVELDVSLVDPTGGDPLVGPTKLSTTSAIAGVKVVLIETQTEGVLAKAPANGNSLPPLGEADGMLGSSSRPLESAGSWVVFNEQGQAAMMRSELGVFDPCPSPSVGYSGDPTHSCESSSRRFISRSERKKTCRATSGSISNSISDSGIQNCNNKFWIKNKEIEARRIWESAKELGVSHSGNEEEIIRRLVNLDTRDANGVDSGRGPETEGEKVGAL